MDRRRTLEARAAIFWHWMAHPARSSWLYDIMRTVCGRKLQLRTKEDLGLYGNMELRGLYYSDTRLGAPVDWKASPHFSSAARSWCCSCHRPTCEFCGEPRPPNVPLLRAIWSLLDGIWGSLKGRGLLEDHLLLEVTPMAGCKSGRTFRPLTLLQSRSLTTDLVVQIDDYLHPMSLPDV